MYTVAERQGFSLEVGSYHPDEWFSKTASFDKELEGGKRCEVCFQDRLYESYQHMLSIHAEAFTTTLTVSPHKSAEVVNRIGGEIGGEKFLARDFKKRIRMFLEGLL